MFGCLPTGNNRIIMPTTGTRFTEDRFFIREPLK